jgi:hypothetical protein
LQSRFFILTCRLVIELTANCNEKSLTREQAGRHGAALQQAKGCKPSVFPDLRPRALVVAKGAGSGREFTAVRLKRSSNQCLALSCGRHVNVINRLHGACIG